MKLGFVIPVYKHGSTLEDVVQSLLSFGAPVIVVDDGNDGINKEFIQKTAASHNEVVLVTREKNGGKGKAMTSAVKKAHELGLTHIFQIDADGQHDVSECTAFIKASETNPKSLICGYPVYDESAPNLRKKGREFSNMWSRLVTLNGTIVDSLCGFRIYPVEPYYAMLCHGAFIDSHMGYDCDILVHYSWKGLDILSLPVKVTYAKDGVSNFRMVRDNIHISLTYTRLCTGMILRLPYLVVQSLIRKSRLKKKSPDVN